MHGQRGAARKNTSQNSDLLIGTSGHLDVIVKGKIDAADILEVNHEMLRSLFIDHERKFRCRCHPEADNEDDPVRDGLAKVQAAGLHDAALFNVDGRDAMLEKAASVGVLATENEDVRSLREMITYGLKGMSAYSEHALNLGKEDADIYRFIYEALAALLDNSLGADDLVALTLRTGEHGVKAMALLDAGNTSRYGKRSLR